MYELPRIEPMSEQGIKDRAHTVWGEYVREVGPEYVLSHGIFFDEMHDAVIYPKYEIIFDKSEDLGLDDDGVPILGKFLPKENVALVDRKLFATADPRRVFTQYHETTGHGILHGPFLRKNARKYPKLYSTERSIGLSENGFDWKQMNTFEWQANMFAANVAAPRTYVLCMWKKLFGMNRKLIYQGAREYSLTFNDKSSLVNVHSPLKLAWVIAKKMQLYFGGLSAQSLAYQVLEVAIDTNGYDYGDFGRYQVVPGLAPLSNEANIKV